MEFAEMSKDKNWAILNQNPSWIPGTPRKAAVVNFRLLTGHTCMRSHLYKIGISDPPNGHLWDHGPPMKANHLVVCRSLISLDSISRNIGEHVH
ncbi:hypothetical protein TNCV_3120461 [Trichonephila clavipes]|uniref:Uncharacterized protein n=1 Tax=Trichonephila clavipes TaxID=2585209 RepID=A0A8X7BGK0_TRICX|nr:hypothetical protein TNCV_3120461 [Trichonephila clavipes]